MTFFIPLEGGCRAHDHMVVGFNLNNICLENNQTNTIHQTYSKYKQDSETSNYCFYKSVS